MCKHFLELRTAWGSDPRRTPAVQPWTWQQNSQRAPSDRYALERLYDCGSLIQTQTHTPPSLFSLHLMIILATTEGGRGGRERTRGNKEGKRGGKGVSFYKAYPPHLPLYPSVLVLSVPYCANNTDALFVNTSRRTITADTADRWWRAN